MSRAQRCGGLVCDLQNRETGTINTITKFTLRELYMPGFESTSRRGFLTHHGADRNGRFREKLFANYRRQ